MTYRVKTVAVLLATLKWDDIVWTLTRQSDPVCFVIHLVGPVTLLTAHSVRQVTLQLESVYVWRVPG